MRLKVLLPSEIFMSENASKITAEGANGSFCLLPGHIDFVSSLVPGIFSFVAAEGREVYLAVDEGTLVKKGDEVLVSTRNAMTGPDLGLLRKVVEEQFEALNEREKVARTAAAKLEADLIRRFMELNEHVR
ncbi:MAG: F0F1 ATP synthase subunit epsilon [Syntrophales bacterium]|nr:F0F1 ATP synthase subunit epsilon [Syntrophales bacterium]MDD5533267.1 F0F1 ATP synthase subunit epsilon [Syntrophales bacterium]HPL63206.1 F0F1 ATP synthase subunit epsilon [Syntrophales bacterium]